MALCCWAAPALQFPNLFVFNNGGGNDTVNGFTARVVSGDLLDVTDFGITASSGLDSVISIGADTLVQIDADDSVLLIGVNASNQQDDDFIFD